MKIIFTLIALALIHINIAFAQWTKINAIPTQDIDVLTVYGDTILAATDTNLIYKSIDGGVSWNPIVVTNDSILIITLKVIDDKIYAGTFHHGMFISADYGLSWQQSGSSLLAVTGVEKHGTDLYASTLGGGVYKLNQNNGNWIPFNNALPTYSFNVNCILSTATTLFIAAGANGTFYRYDFNTNNWLEEFYYGTLKPGLQIEKLINSSDTLFAVNGNRIIRSEDNGFNWTGDSVGYHNGYSRTIYAGASKHYTVANVIAGGTWIQQRSKFAAAGTTWAVDEEYLPSGYGYDILEFQNKLFLGKADGLYTKNLISGVDAIHNNIDMKIYPTPSSGSAITVSAGSEVDHLMISTVSGQVLYSENVGKREFTIKPDLSAGIYFIYIGLSNGQNMVKKIIIE